jgi:uncharacterized phage protein (TIGR02220 family)
MAEGWIMSGWIKLHRSTIGHWVSSEPELLAMWIWLLCEANYETKTKMFNGQKVTVHRGQLIFGRDKFCEKTGLTSSKVRRFLKLLKSDQQIDQQVFNKYSIITITNYDEYQTIDQQHTSRRPADDQQTTTPKEIKNRRIKEICVDLIEYLNQKASRNFKPTEANTKHIKARLDEEYTEDDIRSVIDSKVAEWKHDSTMDKYLRPATLFNAEKFNQYIGQICKTNNDTGYSAGML